MRYYLSKQILMNFLMNFFKRKKTETKKIISPQKEEKNEQNKEVEYYFNEQGYMVFTEYYHKKRGYCCKNGCKHCPFGFKKSF